MDAVISYLLQVPGSLWPLLGIWAAWSARAGESLRLSAVLADVLGVQHKSYAGVLDCPGSSSLPTGSPTAQQTSCRTKSSLMLPRARRTGHWSAMPSSHPRRRL